MSVFGSMVSAIFGSKHAATVAPTAGGSAAAGIFGHHSIHGDDAIK